MDKKACMKWTMFTSFVVLLIGGLNYLLMGILSFDLFGEVFGFDTIAGRIIYTLFGIAAVTLAAIVIYKSFYVKGQSSPRSNTSASNDTSSKKSR